MGRCAAHEGHDCEVVVLDSEAV